MSPDLWLYATWVGYALAGFVAFVFVAHMPFIPLLRLAFLPVPNKGRMALCFIEAWLKNCLTILPDLLAPIVVPVALLFTPRDAERLPRIFEWWDNDASINGDGWSVLRDGKWIHVFGTELPGERAVPYGDPSYTGDAYYCLGHHPRSFYARWVWLGLRNRASRLSQILGFVHAPDAPVGRWSGGDIANHDGWHVTRVEDKFRYYEELRLGPVYLRLHYGYKVPTIVGRPAAQLVAIGFSLRAA